MLQSTQGLPAKCIFARLCSHICPWREQGAYRFTARPVRMTGTRAATLAWSLDLLADFSVARTFAEKKLLMSAYWHAGGVGCKDSSSTDSGYHSTAAKWRMGLMSVRNSSHMACRISSKLLHAASTPLKAVLLVDCSNDVLHRCSALGGFPHSFPAPSEAVL